ncbi:MAG: hypothetical protein V4719_29645 [Planctomycetota bacterium]
MSKLILETVATDMDRRINEATGQHNYGVFVDFLVTFLPTLMQLLSLCKTPIPPAPTPATPPANPDIAAAWQDAWKMKSRSNAAFHEDTQDYDAHTLRSLARKAKREKRRDGETIRAAEAIEIARQLLDTGRTSDMETLTAGILESRS